MPSSEGESCPTFAIQLWRRVPAGKIKKGKGFIERKITTRKRIGKTIRKESNCDATRASSIDRNLKEIIII